MFSRQQSLAAVLLATVCSVGCGKKQFSITISEDARQTQLTPGEPESKLDTILVFGVATSTATSLKLPDGEPLELVFELTKTELDGRPIPLEMRSTGDFSVDASGKKATWSTQVPGGRIEVPATATFPAGPAPKCQSKLPLTLEGSWKASTSGGWKIEGPASGTLRPVDPLTAYVDCGPVPAIVEHGDAGSSE